jgi:hypothetical protein
VPVRTRSGGCAIDRGAPVGGAWIAIAIVLAAAWARRTTSRARAGTVAAAAAILAGCVHAPIDVAAPGDDAGTPEADAGGTAMQDAGADLDPASRPLRAPAVPVRRVLRRVVHARLYQHDEWTLDAQTPETAAAAIAGLRPTWVAGLVRLDADEAVLPAQVAAFDLVRERVRETSPDAHFDLVLNAQHYETPERITARMSELYDLFHNDVWFFDFWTPAHRERPEVVRAAIRWAHEHDQLVGGNPFGWRDDPRSFPPGSDFVTVDDHDFELDVRALARLAELVPVAFHINNNSQNGATSEACVFIHDLSTDERIDYVGRRARNQDEQRYRMMYPVFFPTCPIGEAYDAARDGTMLDTIARMLDAHG